MNSKSNLCEPVYGFYSIDRKSLNLNEPIECLDILKCINLEKFGNDNLNFAAILINGHNSKNIINRLVTKIISEFNSNNFIKLNTSNEILEFIDNIFQKFENSFLIEMSNLHKKKSDLYKSCKAFKSEIEESNFMVQIDKIENELKSGATISIAAVIKGKIYISNIGDNQIILVSKDGLSTDIDAYQFLLQSVEHSFHNEKEINRIKEDCGLNPDGLRWLSMLSQERCHSRCIGDFEMKRLFTEFDCLTEAKSSPVISTPQVSRCVPFEDHYAYILLVSSGLFYLVRELIYDTDKVHGEISRKFCELKTKNPQNTLNQICKKVLEFYVSEQKQCFDRFINLMSDNCSFSEYSKHDDLSLLVIDMTSKLSDSHIVKEDSNGFEVIDKISPNIPSPTDSLENTNSKDTFGRFTTNTVAPTTAYVNFDEWNRVLALLNPMEMAALDLITNIEESFAPPIAEESESILMSRSTTFEENRSLEIADHLKLSPDYRALHSDSEVN